MSCLPGDFTWFYFGQSPGNRLVRKVGHQLKIKDGVEWGAFILLALATALHVHHPA